MENILIHSGIAILTFTLTNIDDLLLLSFYFSNPSSKTKNIVFGQYLGILTLIVLSLAGALAGKQLNAQWVGLLGLVPIFLGVKALIANYRKNHEDNPSLPMQTGIGLVNISLITIANGGDNIGVYTPLFVSSSTQEIILYTGIFILLIALWCALGYYLVKHPLIKNIFAKYSHTLLPFFLIILGISILYKSNVFQLFNNL